MPLAETGAFSGFFLDYISQKDSLKPFYNRFPAINRFGEQAAEKAASFPAERRIILRNTLERQYSGITQTEAEHKNLESLSSANTFTVVTGHQLNIFTGPLYFIYKIVTAINTCRELSREYPDLHFVPVYWMASEDHDIDEIRYFRLNGKKYVWETRQQGAVGRFALEDLQPLLREIPGDISPFLKAYQSGKTLAEAVRIYVHELFGDQGLIVVDGDDADLKRQFIPVMEADILHNISEKQASISNTHLTAAGYEPQVLVRPINFFHLSDGRRERIEQHGEYFHVLNTEVKMDTAAMQRAILEHPENFSPNVILRPLYQEYILPNLAYVGGPAENVYWLQLKGIFDHFQVPFPMLMPRNFVAVMEAWVSRQFAKSGISVTDLFLSAHDLANRVTLNRTTHDLATRAEQEKADELFQTLAHRAGAIDPTLEKFIGAVARKTRDGLGKISAKMLRAERRRQEAGIRQALGVKEALFPGGGLQERTDNLLRFYQTDRKFIHQLIDHLKPFDFRFQVLMHD